MWAVGDDLNAELSREAFRRAATKRSPPLGLIFHSDRGSEFAAKRFCDALKTVGAAQTTSRSGDCWDNAPSESFSSTVEFEFEAGAASREEADSDPELFAFIEVWYNAERPHSQRDPESERSGGPLTEGCVSHTNSVPTETGQAHRSATFPSRA